MYTYTATNYHLATPQTKFYYLVGNVSEAMCHNKKIKYEVVLAKKEDLIIEPFVIKLKVNNKLVEVIGAFDSENEAQKEAAESNAFQARKIKEKSE